MARDKEKMVRSEIAKKEEEILEFWQREKIFKQSEARLATEEFVFYDGPPFATGLPHYGHILAGTMKDVIPRYQTMRGKRVRRRWGWDCHGLPLENIIEQELGLKTKKDILDLGIGKFNAASRAAVLRFADDWREIVPRLGRFVDMADDYKTMDASYTETVWWIFKTLYDKKLIYEGYKVMHLCPRCGTTLSNFEVNQGYKEIEGLAVTAEFELIDEPGTFLLAWTTTAWTLPGNVALAVNPEIEYVEVAGAVAGNKYILAIGQVEKVFGADYKILKKFPGRELIGKKYKTLFDYYQAEGQVYGAEFVTTAEGTGIVHLAPAFGDDDYALAKREKLPFVQHVGFDGKFKPEVKDFAGLAAKPKDAPQETDKKIIKFLEKQDKIFKFEQITHSYPHCWRCETPLLNYAASSWFVEVSQFKDQLVAANKNITWIPEHIKDGRFGKWLEGARDWAISRSRFWGAPLPVWRCEECEKMEVIGTLSELKRRLPEAKNKYLAFRHGEAQSNLENRVSSRVENDDHLTTVGIAEVKAAIPQLLAEKVDLIVSSDFPRTRETAELIATGLGLDKDKIIFDQRWREINADGLEGRSWNEYDEFFAHHRRELDTRLPGGESLSDVRQRTLTAILELEGKYAGQNILIVSHGLPIFSILAAAAGAPDEKLAELKTAFGPVKRAKPYPLDLVLFPRNETGALDLHRPYIDEVKLTCKHCGGAMTRAPEVFDCWFESGAMPYGESHYLGEPRPDFDPRKHLGFPADFIAEGLDQTRGWFYSLLVLGVALFGETPYKNVIVNGLVLAADGQKMSKRLKNYPDPLELVDRYGADALRFYLMSAPVVRAEDLNFSESGVAEVSRKIVGRLLNVLNFYQTYSDLNHPTFNLQSPTSNSVLDQWILSRLAQTHDEVTTNLDRYELDRAARALDVFIDDLSNWYLRRSRERFKSSDPAEREAANFTTHHVLRELAKLLAPFTPFLAERVWEALKHEGDLASVHLTDWPGEGEVAEEVLVNMKRVRELVEAALAARGENKIKVRQPLAVLTLKEDLPPAYQQILKDEVNVKNIAIDPKLEAALELDFKITPALKAEGQARELIRQIQELRKKSGAGPTDLVMLEIGGDEAALALVNNFADVIKQATRAKDIKTGGEDGTIVQIDELEFTLAIKL